MYIEAGGWWSLLILRTTAWLPVSGRSQTTKPPGSKEPIEGKLTVGSHIFCLKHFARQEMNMFARLPFAFDPLI